MWGSPIFENDEEREAFIQSMNRATAGCRAPFDQEAEVQESDIIPNDAFMEADIEERTNSFLRTLDEIRALPEVPSEYNLA